MTSAWPFIAGHHLYVMWCNRGFCNKLPLPEVVLEGTARLCCCSKDSTVLFVKTQHAVLVTVLNKEKLMLPVWCCAAKMQNDSACDLPLLSASRHCCLCQWVCTPVELIEITLACGNVGNVSKSAGMIFGKSEKSSIKISNFTERCHCGCQFV